ncbi:titin homolog isoform X2 [Coccinella septempunctata]|uniref:titin homolog isoform X2 n=1 Tax=Coccinella septempunctata TaxID=41139 RepID=UPI001D069643|nr:titin homolog isoform X2 [Coccinella septempunctata]
MERNVNCSVGTESSESEVGETTNSPNFTALLNKARENICGAKNLHNIVDSVANDIKTNYRKSIVKRAVHPVLVCSTPFSTQKTKNEDSFSNFSTLSGLSDQPKNEKLPSNKEKKRREDINIEIGKPDISIKNQETKPEIVDPDEFIEISDQEQTLTENNVEEELKKNCSDKIESATSNVDISSNKEETKKNKKDDSKIIIVKEKSIDRTSRKKTRSPSEVKKSCIEYDYVTEDSEEESETVLERRKRREKFSAAFSNHKNRMVKVHKGRSLSRKSKKYVIITESSEDDRKQRRKHSVKNREGRVIRVPLSESDVEVKRIRKQRGISRSSRYKYHVVDTDTSISSEHSESDSSSYYESKKQYLKHKSEKKAKIRDKSRLHRPQFSQNVRREYSRGRRETKFLAVDDNHYRDKSKRLSRKDTFNLQSKTNRKKEKFRDIAHDISSSTIESTKTTKVVDLLSEIRNLLTVQKKEDSKGKNIVPEITNVANHDTIDNMNRKEMDFPVEAKKADMSTNQNLKKTKSDDADASNKIDINTNENVVKTKKTHNSDIVNKAHVKTNENLNKIKGDDTDVISRTHITTNENVKKAKRDNADIINKTHINTDENLKKVKRDNVDMITKRLVKTGENLNKIKGDDAGVINETHVNDEPNQNELEPPLTPLLLKLNKVIKDEDLQFYRVRMDLLREHNNKTKRKLLRKIARQPNSFEYNKKAKISLFRNNKRCKKKKYVCRKKLDDVLASLSKNSAKKNRRTNTIGVQTSLIKTLEDSQPNVRVTRSKDSPKSAEPNAVEHKKNSPLVKSPSEKNYLEKLRAEYISDSFEVSVVSTGAQSCEQNVIILQNLTVQKKRTEDDVVSSEDGEKVTGELLTKNKPRIPIHWAPLPCNVDDSSSENFNEDLELTQSVTSTESTYTPAIIMGKDAMKPAKVDRAEDALEFSKGRSPQDKLGKKGKGGKENQKPPSKKDVINSPSSQNSPIDRKKMAKTTRKISPASESDDVVRIQQETTDKNEFLAKMDLSPHSEKHREVPNKSKKELRCKLNFEDTDTEPLDMDSGIKSDDLPSPRKTAIERRKQQIAQGRGVGTDKKVVSPHFVKPSKVPVRSKKKLPCTKLELQDSDTELLHTDAGIKNDAMEGMKRTSPRRKPAETRASVSPDDSREPKSFGSKHKRDIAEENVQEMNMDSGISNGSSVPPSNKKEHNLPEIYVQTSEIQETEASSRKTPQENNISSSEISADVSEEYFAKPVGVPKKSKKKPKSPISKKDAVVEKQEKKKATKKQPSARAKKNKEAPEKNDSEVVVRRSNREKKAVDLDLFARIIQYSEKEVRKNAESAATSLVSEQSKNTSKSRSNKKTTSAAAKNVEKKESASRKTRASRQAENALIKSKTDKSKGTTEEIPDEVEAQGSSENIEIPVVFFCSA